MKVRRLKKCDWTFGGSSTTISGDDAILQRVSTRIKSFKGDWFLDFDAGIDWFLYLGSKNNEEKIKRDILNICKKTEGVLRVNSVEISSNENREAVISINLDTIYSQNNNIEETV